MKFQDFENIRQVNRYFRSTDESHKWPICGKFNATERAIRRLRKQRKEGLCLDVTEYAYALDAEISYIVNHVF